MIETLGQQSHVRARIVITLTTDNQTMVEGAINDKVLAYGLLAVAQDAVRDYHTQQQQRVQPVSVLPPGLSS